MRAPSPRKLGALSSLAPKVARKAPRDVFPEASHSERHAAKPSPARPAWQGASLGLPEAQRSELIRRVRSGLPVRSLEVLAANSGMAISELATNLEIPARTMARRKAAGKLSPEESERALRLATVFERALGLFEGNVPEALRWLRQPKKALGGESPLEYSRTELGAREVENLIGRLEHGVFS
jgi:putative toxin-antitoxin system antitoxin component (TIGR02293 family)